MNLSGIQLTEAVKILLYSTPGIGKTFFTGSVGSRNVIISNRNGLATLKSKLFKSLYPNSDPIVEVIDSLHDTTQATAYPAIVDRISQWFEKRLPDFDAITIDDGSFLGTSALNYAIKLNGGEGKSQTKGKVSGMSGYVMPARQDFGTAMGLTENVIRDVASMCDYYQKHFIVNAHERNIYKEVIVNGKKEEQLDKVVPNFVGRASPEAIGGYFDIVARMTRLGVGEATKVQFQFQPSGVITAKDRYSVFKTTETSLDFPKILARIQALEPQTSIES